MIVVAGVPGSGKTSVIKEAKKHVDFTYVNLGDLFLEEAKKMGIEKRDEIREKLDRESYALLQKKVFERAKGYDVIDTHYMIATGPAFMHGIPEDVLEQLPVRVFVLIEAKEEEIRKRREKDSEVRERGKGVEEDIEAHQFLNRVAAVLYSWKSGARVCIIHNKEGALEESGLAFAEVVRAWKSGLL